MRVTDPLPFFGIESGIKVLRPTAAEAKVLLRAAQILEKGHDLIAELDPDHQDCDSLSDALCMAPPAIRELCEGIQL